MVLRHFKGNTSGVPFTLNISQSDNPKYCPVRVLLAYLANLRTKSGPLFQFLDGAGVSRHYFCNKLDMCLTALGLKGNNYKSHSFRIGAATTAALKGVSDPEIQKMGCWFSDTFWRYIQIPQLNTK